MKTLNCVLLLMISLCATNLFSQTNKYSRIQVVAIPDSVKQWNKNGLLPAHFSYNNNLLEMELTSIEMAEFKTRKIEYTDISQSFYSNTSTEKNQNSSRLMGSQIAPVNYSHGSMGGYHTYDEAMNVLDEMRIKFPALVSKKDTLGWTYEGRPIVAVRISDHPDEQESNEDEWLMTALHHANEVMGEEIVFYFSWFLLENYEHDKEIQTLLNNSAVYIVPVVNPDGLVYNEVTNPTGGGGWRKNRKPRIISSTTHYGVDLNRNYGYNRAYTHVGQLGQAGSSFAGNDYYRGTAAWSEAETSAIREFCKKHRFIAAFNYHAWDDSFNYPWNFDIDFLTPDSDKYNTIAAYCTEDNHFEKGTFNRTLGYTANGTSDDWLYGEQTEKNKIFAFTIEVGKSFWPAPSLIDKYCDSLLQANMKMLRMAAKYASVVETSLDTTMSLSNTISFDIKRYSITDTVFTVSITPIDPIVSSTESPKTYSDLNLLETRSESLSFLLSPSITDGTNFRLLLKVDNGTWSVTDTITKVYRSSSTLPIGCDEADEPNNSSTAAKKIVEGELLAASISNKLDEDWYYFSNTVEKKNIRIVLSNLPADYDIELFSANGKSVSNSQRPFRQSDTIVFNTTETGVYKIRVYGFKHSFQSYKCYNLLLSLDKNRYHETSYYPNKEKQLSSFSIAAFPTPTTTSVSIAIKTNQSQQINWTLIDAAGKNLKTGNRKLINGLSTFTIDINELVAGIYKLLIFSETNGVVESTTIIKQ